MGNIQQISEDPKIRVDPHCCLWRYISLSTLFLNLDGTAYIPTIAQLRKSDPKEGLAAVSDDWRLEALFRNHETIKRIVETLPPEKQRLIRAGDRSNCADMMQNSRIIADAYDEQQLQLKCAWCWHCASHESAAMWKLYAGSGVAVETTLARIGLALPNDVSFEVAQMQYGNRESGQSDSFDPEAGGIGDILSRSYLFKNNDYDFEKEVRLVFDAESSGCGRLISGIAPTKLFKRIVFSPWMSAGEFRALEKRIREMHPQNEFLISRSPLLRELDDEEAENRMSRLLSTETDS